MTDAEDIEHLALNLVGCSLVERHAANEAADLIEKHIATGYYDGEADNLLVYIVSYLRGIERGRPAVAQGPTRLSMDECRHDWVYLRDDVGVVANRTCHLCGKRQDTLETLTAVLREVARKAEAPDA